MKIHNIMEDIVEAEIESVCAGMENDPVHKDLCTCPQCRLDAACYVLNRLPPRYFVSSRGLERAEVFSFKKQQEVTDLIKLIFDAFKTVGHNKRPNHGYKNAQAESKIEAGKPVFNIPAIVGRLLNGHNFAPMADISAGLYMDGELIPMNNENWQNPCVLNPKTEGCFTFWPEAIAAKKMGEEKVFGFNIKAAAEGFDPLNHFFEITVASEYYPAQSITMERTLKLPSLYMFPPEQES
ncbi:MAG: late competence development ComFB family protein [Spirochaetaceae bacterium]|nr:late competence development ComFB family protein [Spirochaetaceae bacterium]